MTHNASTQAPLPASTAATTGSGSLHWLTGWLPLALLPLLVIVVLSPPTVAPWVFMWSLAFAIFCGCKWLTWRCSVVSNGSLWRNVGYLAAWPGLDAPAFLNPQRTPATPTLHEWAFAAAKLLLGFVCFFGIPRLLPSVLLHSAGGAYLAGWVGMVGLIMMLHFGLFHLLSCGWRHIGVDAQPLMDWPIAAHSLSEFWGRRWNTAFRDLTHRYLFRPLTTRLGATWAVIAGFTTSGLVHDLVISYPAGGGYGMPTAYFLLQGIGLLTERSPLGRRWGLRNGWPGRWFTLALLLVPVPLLFHSPFVINIILPFMQSAGALQ